VQTTLRAQGQRPRLVSFSGVDGAGKSTQIEALTAFLQQAGITYSLYTFWDDVVALGKLRERMSRKIFKGDEGVGSPENPIQRRDKNVTSWYARLSRFFLYGLDAVKLSIFVKSLQRDKHLVIFDRYMFDELANLPLENKVTRFYIRLILSCIPTPDVALLLDADPESATRRKPEYPIEFVRRNRVRYLELSQIAGMKVIPPGEINRTAEAIRDLVYSEGLQPTLVSADNLKYI
jgi:thymidylate kinase